MPKSQRKQRHQVERPRSLRPTFIRQWRKKKGWSQGELAETIGVSTATISQIENGNTGYSQANIEAIAWALDCQVVDLVARDPDELESLWTLWERARPEQREQILKMFAAMLS